MTIPVALIVLIIWSFYRLNFPENFYLDEIVLKPLVWLLPVFIVTKFKKIGFDRKNILKNIFIGLTFGLIISLERVYVQHQSAADIKILTIILTIITCFFTALVEEIFFRGFLLNRWLKYFKTPFVALLLNGIFFTSTHLPIAIFQLHYTGYALLVYCLSNFVSGFVDILLFFYTGSLYAPIANHFVWNIFSTIFR